MSPRRAYNTGRSGAGQAKERRPESWVGDLADSHASVNSVTAPSPMVFSFVEHQHHPGFCTTSGSELRQADEATLYTPHTQTNNGVTE